MLIDSTYLPTPDAPLVGLRPDLDSPGTLVLVFSGHSRETMEVPIKTIQAAFPLSIVMGCSTSGEVSGATVRDGGISLAVVRFEQTTLTSAYAAIKDASASFAGGVELARKLTADSLTGVLVFSDGLNVNGSQLAAGLNSELTDGVVVTGGLAGDADRFAATWVVADGHPKAGYVAAIGLHGDAVTFGYGSRGGWDIFGPERVVSRSEANVVYELDGRSALDLYQEYLGDLSDELPGSGLFFPLAIKKGPDDGDVLVRTLLAVNHEDRSLTFAGDVPAGWTAQFMRTNFDRLVDGAAEAAADASSRAEISGECLALAISCVGRRLVLKDRVEEELEAISSGLPGGTHMVGFYSYGEISPLSSGRCDLHNQTMTLTTLSERRA